MIETANKATERRVRTEVAWFEVVEDLKRAGATQVLPPPQIITNFACHPSLRRSRWLNALQGARFAHSATTSRAPTAAIPTAKT
ncbi:MAG: hypothetical protein ACI85K_002414 [Hyphomicrobiaceae bacterium]